jgi:type III restriction enzyme
LRITGAISSSLGSLRSYAHQKYILVLCLVESLGDLGEQVSQVVIENPIINSPFDEPTRHFRFDDEGITDQEVVGRRVSHYFVPIARPRKKNGAAEQGVFDTEWTQDRIEENKLVNDIRRRVVIWRKGGFVGVTPIGSKIEQ